MARMCYSIFAAIVLSQILIVGGKPSWKEYRKPHEDLGFMVGNAIGKAIGAFTDAVAYGAGAVISSETDLALVSLATLERVLHKGGREIDYVMKPIYQHLDRKFHFHYNLGKRVTREELKNILGLLKRLPRDCQETVATEILEEMPEMTLRQFEQAVEDLQLEQLVSLTRLYASVRYRSIITKAITRRNSSEDDERYNKRAHYEKEEPRKRTKTGGRSRGRDRSMRPRKRSRSASRDSRTRRRRDEDRRRVRSSASRDPAPKPKRSSSRRTRDNDRSVRNRRRSNDRTAKDFEADKPRRDRDRRRSRSLSSDTSAVTQRRKLRPILKLPDGRSKSKFDRQSPSVKPSTIAAPARSVKISVSAGPRSAKSNAGRRVRFASNNDSSQKTKLQADVSSVTNKSTPRAKSVRSARSVRSTG